MTDDAAGGLWPAPSADRAAGMAYYVSDVEGTGGRLRDRPADFRVRELESVDAEPVDADPGAYPHVVVRVTLTDRDTNGFAADLADRLGISRERITWAGTKDKRAVTTQLMSITNWQTPGSPSLPTITGAEMTVVGRVGRPVLFGDLHGNAFEVVVRDAERPAAIGPVTRALVAVRGGDAAAETDTESDPKAPSGIGAATGDERPTGRSVAVPNYFGSQRFGSRRPVTHEVGLAIVRGDWGGAVRAYLGLTGAGEPESTRTAREYVAATDDWQGALERFPDRLGHERAILHRLVERGCGTDRSATAADFRAALEALPTNLQRLLVNAAQSYLFNRMVSARLERGLELVEPVVGDVICFAGDDGRPDPDRRQRVTDARLETVRRHCERERAFVTAPLVGTETALGEGVPGEIERSVLETADVAPADFDLPGEFGSTGTRRAVSVHTAVTARPGDRDGDGDTSDHHDAHDAYALTFELPAGAYATVLLREYLKSTPSTDG